MIFGKHVNRYYLKYAPMFLLGTLSLLLVDYLQLLLPELYRMVVNGISNGTVQLDGVSYAFDMDFLLDRICLPLIFVIVGMVFGRILWRMCFTGTAIRVTTDIRGRMFDKCKDLSQQYYQVNKVGNLMSLFTNDIETVQECFGWGTIKFVDALILGTFAFIKMFGMNVILTLLSMIPLVCLFLSALIMGRYMEKKWAQRQAAFSDISDFSQETFAGMAVIKAFVKEAHELSRFKKLNKNNEKVNVEYTKLSVLLNVSMTLFIESITCVILGYGGYVVWKGEFDAGQLVEFIGYFTAIIWPVMAVSDLIGMHAQGKASLKRISKLLDAEPDVCDREGVESVTDIKGNIEFRNLTFKYPETDFEVLSDVSFKINAGENVGIIGRTGSGKTTLVDLILRTYNVPDGSLFIDGKDVNTIPIKDVRAAAAYVPQDNFLFSDTIEHNISFSDDDVNGEEVEFAAKMADVHDNIIDFPDKYDSVLGERGVTVSGGQKQRISIARALMKNAPILILDDSVSAVDVDTEKEILTNLRNIRKGMTTILIAHRISTVENMDKIIYLEGGKVVAVGNHDELYNGCEGYRNLVELQRLDDESEGNDKNVEVSADA